MSNQVFPTLPGLGFTFVKRPKFYSQVQWSATYRRTSISYTPYPVFDYDLTVDILRTMTPFSELQTLMGFFTNRQGKFDSFLIDDPDDDLVTDQAIGTGDATTLAFQMVRTYGAFVQPVFDIKNSGPTPIVKVAGVVIDPANYTIGYNSSGMLTFAGGHAPGAAQAITATFGYYWRVSFADDTMDFEKFMKYRFQVQGIKLLGETL